MEKCFDLLNGASVQKQESGPTVPVDQIQKCVCVRVKNAILVYSIPPLSGKSTGSPGP